MSGTEEEIEIKLFWIRIDLIAKSLPIIWKALFLSDPKGIRTPITAVKGRGPNH